MAGVIGGLVWSFMYLKDIHPLGSLASRLGRDKMPGVAIRFEGAQLVGRSGGRPVWLIKAKTIDLSKDRRKATFRGLTNGELLQDGKKIASISAPEVVYNVITQDVAAPSAAKLSITNGPSFTVRKVFWNARTSRLFCEEVDAKLGANTMHGKRMTADLEKKEINASQVSGTIRLE